MKHRSLKTMIAVRFALVALAVVFLVSMAANVLISRQFEKYVEEEQNAKAEELAQNLAYQYNSETGGWNLDYVHGFGMYALNEGYIIKLCDAEENVIWDAENHDMTLCRQMMNAITLRMQENRPDLGGNFAAHRFDLKKDGNTVGFLYVSFYGPYYFNEDDFQFITALNKILAAVAAISLPGAVAIGLLLAGSITKPVIKAAEMTNEISEGDYSIRFSDEAKAKELYSLGQAVNHMAESLEEQEARSRRLTSDVAHELRTPLTNVASYLEAMIEGVWEPTPERLQSCYDEIGRLTSLVTDLERLRQVESADLKLNKTQIDLFELANTTAVNFETQLEKKKLRCEVKGSHVQVPADRDRILQVVTNLLSNAIKYSGGNGAVRIVTENTAEFGVIRVEDDGIGIAKEDIDLIFERFYRADKSRNRKTGGAGIGLAIVKSIVKAHGGKVTVESEEGLGSSFSVYLPKGQS